MANTSAPFGFVHVGVVAGAAPNFMNSVRKIKSDNSTAIYFGDAVIPLTTGYIGQATASTVQMAGIFIGCKYYNTSLKRQVWSNYWPGSGNTGDIEAWVIDDPNALFRVQAGGTAITIADIGANVQLNVGTGNANTGISGMYVESANTVNTLPFRVVGLVEAPPGANGTDSASAYNQVLVAFNNSNFKQLLGI